MSTPAKGQRSAQDTKAAPAVESAPAVEEPRKPINTTNLSLILVLASRLLAKPSVVLEAERAPIEARVRALAVETFGGALGDWTVEGAFEHAKELSR